jgi:site-specific DNA-methyltransferase (adenine-specific)
MNKKRDELDQDLHSVAFGGGLFFNSDCIRGARVCVPDNSVDLIITDPPYGIQGDQLHRHYNRREDLIVEGYVEVPADEYGTFSLAWIREAERILRPGGSLYIVSGYTNLYHILDALRQTSLQEVNHIIWRYNFGVFTRRKFVSSHYHILFYEKPGGTRTFNTEVRYGFVEKGPGGESLNYHDREDVWLINRHYKPGQVRNKNELPASLLIKMIQYSSNEGDTVCDLFLGGFSTAKAAIGLNRKIVGFEISTEIFEVKAEETRSVQPGSLLPSLRAPLIGRIINQGRTWTPVERESLVTAYARMLSLGMKKKEIVDLLMNRFGRGRWAILKMLKRCTDEDQNPSDDQPDDSSML